MLGCECLFARVDQLTGSIPLYDKASNRVTAIGSGLPLKPLYLSEEMKFYQVGKIFLGNSCQKNNKLGMLRRILAIPLLLKSLICSSSQTNSLCLNCSKYNLGPGLGPVGD